MAKNLIETWDGPDVPVDTLPHWMSCALEQVRRVLVDGQQRYHAGGLFLLPSLEQDRIFVVHRSCPECINTDCDLQAYELEQHHSQELGALARHLARHGMLTQLDLYDYADQGKWLPDLEVRLYQCPVADCDDKTVAPALPCSYFTHQGVAR